ncbi:MULTISPECIES: bifunctional alpha,alpha-trehalose-phosphate synthase (UDP-forming)/trehalose-phosphatase [Agromyces]|uniref:Alpha,alpha-trehalose-phosphate synthase n=1 Tax=Agromyces mediolanus TaxID=41986 RepID=A0A918CH65_AGRME|nr:MULTISPECIES: bifunctional alpha,alpha-trehalose-phosphate synthase (UDP-forming)/trehalose-phosphatase [Agromyces]MCD1569844.1 bifunctional alpha,alpha-trehalose-phosphate synthase (UDP-forming)/trehalose-phosphatase [Agromyces mediolanus]GGR22882.1 bifunctional alpha,alpha-trehalose-phosphate synthase (UDP-forming)/trehalose-phosphatase [Agromyces mediolanus]GLJ71167.1 bifunctional alpha,alpha-trehalose-phosphate synthase (UDP-forming)/trehalose-phosphatase [Agromyces mediolanus]GLU89649.1
MPDAQTPTTTRGVRAAYEMIVVSNRLPVDYVESADGTPGWRSSPGGLVTALEPVMRAEDGAWIGWAGVADREFEPFAHDGIEIIPVPLTADELEDYYEGFSNDTLWPLYHDVIAPPSFHREWWDAYVRVNRRFADAAIEAAAEGAVVWVHDYQLQLVPKMLREARPDLVIGFFNHIPFPAYGIYSQLPWRRQVIEGLLGADVVGFQRAADAGNFTRAVRRLFGYATRGSIIEVPEEDGELRRVVARHFPISIDAAGFEEIARRPEVQERAAEIRRNLGDPETIMLGVDRLDYTKGIRHRMKAFGELLRDGRLSVEDATLVQVASPSRERVETYRQLRDEIELMVGRLNGDHGELGHPAISYLHHGYPREEMVALYLAADVMLVTALRDGMNLVAKEYVACRFDDDGVLLLSEFTGASDELRQAVLVNPHDIEGLKDAMIAAVEMPKGERARRMRALRRRVQSNDVANWSATFLEALTGAGKIPAGVSDSLSAAVSRLAGTERLLVALDFDGTLAPLVDRPEDARASARARAAVERLIASDDTRVAFVSGRSLESLREVADPPEGVLLSGSHGVELQLDDGGVTIELRDVEHARLARLTELLEDAASEADGAWVEHKPAGLALHTRRLPVTVGAALQHSARERIEDELPGITVRSGKAVIEFAVRSSDKGESLTRVRQYLGSTAVLYVGDDVTDEDAFAVLDVDDVGVKVGQGKSLAGHRVRGTEDVALLLETLADAREAAREHTSR